MFAAISPGGQGARPQASTRKGKDGRQDGGDGDAKVVPDA